MPSPPPADSPDAATSTPLSDSRPPLTLLDLQAAVGVAQPTDIVAVVTQLQRQFRAQSSPRELALLVSGMFMGRQGLARELRRQALVARLTGQPVDQTLMAALIRLQYVATSLYDSQPL